MNHSVHQRSAICTLSMVGLLVAGSAGSFKSAMAQGPAAQGPTWHSQTTHATSGESQLQILGTRSLPENSAKTLLVQNTEPAQAEPIGPGTPQADGSALPPLVKVPASVPGGNEEIQFDWKPIGAVSASIAPPAGDLPANLAQRRFAQAGTVFAPVNPSRDWPTFSYSWEASAVGHNPLYFEDANLERYGYSHGFLQPLISGGRFFTTVVFLPYKIVAHPPREIIYPLGYYRPGDPAPPVREIEPIKLSAAVVEAAFVVGMIVILP